MPEQNKAIKGIIAIILSSVFWGTTGTVASFSTQVSPLATGAFAMGVGGVLLLVSAYKSIFKDFQKVIAQPKLLLVGGLSIAVYPLVFYTSMHWSGVAIGTVISIASAPFFSFLLERLINNKPISVRWIVSFLFGTVGIILLTLGEQKNPGDSLITATYYWGIALGLIAGLTYATYSWVAKQMIGNGISSTSTMASMFGLAAVVLLPSLLFTGENLFSGNANISVALYMAVIPMFLGYLLFGYGLRHVHASEATLITLLEPVVATLLAVLIVGEVFNYLGWLGMSSIGVCLLLQIFKPRNKVSSFV